MTTSPWDNEHVAVEQRALVDQQLERWKAGEPVPHFQALHDAVASTKCPGSILEVGCASGYSLEMVPEEFRPQFSGVDISGTAIEIARKRHPSGHWFHADATKPMVPENEPRSKRDVVVDGSCLLHIDDWKDHLRRLCALSRRWVILHRVPIGAETKRIETKGYGQTFPAWRFAAADIEAEMARQRFELVQTFPADDGASTAVFAKPRRFVSYADDNYLTRLRALDDSLQRHAGPCTLDVLSWGERVTEWAKTRPHVRVVDVKEFLAARPSLRPEGLPGPARTRVEHMWTVGPSFCADVMRRTGDPVAYADADVCFLSSPEPSFAEVGGAPAGFSGHHFATKAMGLPGPTVESHSCFGSRNVGFLIWNDLAVVERWAEMVRGWCIDRVEQVEAIGGPVPITDRRFRYADQAYLDDLGREFPGIVTLSPQAMLGPWSVHTRELDVRDGVVTFGGKALASFHFSSLKLGPHGQWQPTRPEYRITQRQIDILYLPYLKEIER